MSTPITNFDAGDEYSFLSNFYVSPIQIRDIEYKTVEHYFQANKAKDYDTHMAIVNTPHPGRAKSLGRRVDLREDWEEIKNKVMFTGVMLKFLTHESLQQRLLNTGDVLLFEGNTWDDRVWGVVWDEERGWVGENRLGRILMDVREILKEWY